MLKKCAPSAVLLVALAVAYAPLVTNSGIVITDDSFTSDIANGEWPLRIEIGRLIRSGSAPVWSRTLYGGHPLLPASPAAEPLTLLLFSTLSPVAALNAYLLAVLALSALGTAVLARALGASPPASAIAGLAFAFSGSMVCQLKHLGIVSCVSLTPWALWALLRAFSQSPSRATTIKWLAAFAAFVGLQWLSGFAQTSYITTLLYMAWGFFLIGANRVRWVGNVIGFGLAGLFGALIGAVQLIAIFEHTKLTTRSEGVTVEWATRFNYWLPQLWSFIWPYKNGDISDHTFTGQGIFWEDYSYAGIITLLLALSTLLIVRTAWVRFWWVASLLALLLVLGKHTPLFTLAFHVLPGLKFFRFPTRFLFVVHLGMSLLAGLGLTHLEYLVGTKAKASGARLAPVLGWLLVGLSFVDLQHFQLRQNAIADAEAWVAEPETVTFLRANLGEGRVYSYLAKTAHQRAAIAAHGWADLEPFYAIRELLQPASNWVWGVPVVDGYTGLPPVASGFLWGSSQTPSRMLGLGEAAKDNPLLFAELTRLLRIFGVKYVIAPFAIRELGEPLAVGNAFVHELEHPAARFHVATRLQGVESDDAAFAAMRQPAFEPGHDVLFIGRPAPPLERALAGDEPPRVQLVAETPLSSEVTLTSSGEAWLVNTETFHPNWVAELDGVRVPVLRANINQRAVKVPAGTHTVRFFFDAPSYRVGLMVTLASALAVGVAMLAAARQARR